MFSPVKNQLVRLLILIASGQGAAALAQPDYDVREHYNKYEHLIPMRDGVRLFTAVYAPKDTSGTHPFLMRRTPYSVSPYGSDSYPEVLGPHPGFARDGFIFVFQDVRGRFMSEGEFVNVRPYLPVKSVPRDVDENTDTYDTIEWLLENVLGHNGRVGIYGISYPGYYSAYGIIDGHPAIKAASPQAPVGDWFIGDDWHHHGAFLLQDAFFFFSTVGQPRPGPSPKRPKHLEIQMRDAYRMFLEMGPLSNADPMYFKGKLSFWNDLMEHGTYDQFWQKRNIIPSMKNVKSAVVVVAGLFDAEDPYGPLKIYHEIERQNPGIVNTLVLGPWYHGGWTHSDGDRLGNVQFHVKTSHDYQELVDLPFFRHYLKDEGELDLPEALVFLTGSNNWRRFDSWPPREIESANLYMGRQGTLSFSVNSTGEGAYDEYLSDPSNPVPYTQEVRIDRTIEYMVEDQRFAGRRPDVLVYRSEVLTEDVALVGPVAAQLFVSSTGTDADFVVKLIDVYPDDFPPLPAKEQYLQVPMSGYQMLVRGEVMRAKFRNSYSVPEPLIPGRVSRVQFDMPDIAHTFKRGHRIMVQVQSSWFPLVDRNPQKFLNIYRASESDYQKATHRIYLSGAQASRVKVNVLRP